MIKELVKKNRSYRRFYQDKKLTKQQLMELVEVARLTPSAANRQPFKYRIVCDEEENEKVFRLLGFAGYLKDWDGPSEGEKPTGYIVITCPAMSMMKLMRELSDRQCFWQLQKPDLADVSLAMSKEMS